MSHELCFLGAVELERRLRAKEISAREVMAAHRPESAEYLRPRA